MKRESGENPLQPPLLYVGMFRQIVCHWENREGGQEQMIHEPGDLPVEVDRTSPSEGRIGSVLLCAISPNPDRIGLSLLDLPYFLYKFHANYQLGRWIVK